ncbi:DUF4159 domain-containing protein [Phyllobacterium leguminum]|uniref:Putative membrane protein (TIGR02226 family) n=1 Tax=Phyllobacterium leguminum TaxID=314237 RepID=A0A318TF75_9HYPH|nr:DUF4159 domain-containing protein [Phyllobacterium leguminum]PYE87104.1 putative membrane protein (TIGR02226 family) [Phyllobacterium leguminum]
MNALPLAFGAPMLLVGLITLPVIWWLLRMTPPPPQKEVFPPLKILAHVLRQEQTPNRSPWWMTLLRLLIAALVILALAEPVWNPRPVTLSGNGPVAIIVDNGWASAEAWEQRRETAERLIADAARAGAPIYLVGTAERANAQIGPFDAAGARERLQAMEPRPIPVDRKAAFERLAPALAPTPGARIAWLSDGILTGDAEDATKSLEKSGAASLLWYRPDTANLLGLTSVENGADALVVHAIRPMGAGGSRSATVAAFDNKGRRIGEASLAFSPGASVAEARIAAPIELRNDFSSLRIDGASQAAATRLLDDNTKRRRVALLSGAEADVAAAQPLLSPLYYISRALQPYADLIEPRTTDLAQAVPELLDQKPSVLVMADIGKLPQAAEERLADWVSRGGTLIRFAGPKLAGASSDDTLLPVTLRRGERALGGTLTWTAPQPLSAFAASGPFAGLATPKDVTVTRQVLAEPSPDLPEKTWASLADGTPLISGETRDRGRIVLFHVAPDAAWSNLPISGVFVEMLRRIIVLSRAGGGEKGSSAVSLPPYLILAADGSLKPPAPETKPLAVGGDGAPQVSYDNPPGFYGSDDALYALNLLGSKSELAPLIQPSLPFPVSATVYAADESISLRGPLFAAAAMLLALDTLLMLWLGGHLRLPRRKTAALGIMLLAGFFTAAAPFSGGHALAQVAPSAPDDAKPGDQAMISAVSATHLAYIVTGDKAVDDISKAGLEGLTQFLKEKTALEPGEPIGVDPARDELSFYPLIYWPIDANAPMPNETAIARVDAYMQGGGTVLFDTRDELAASAAPGGTTPSGQRLRAILDSMNVPPLEPVPSDHVLSKSFYIMPDFPGRYRGAPLWVEASLNGETRQDRPVRTGDGVSPILITANDLAGAWAIDSRGAPLLPTVPNDPMQRAYALRGGVNIMMYMLTGNYKSDQVHVPALLERLGN